MKRIIGNEKGFPEFRGPKNGTYPGSREVFEKGSSRSEDVGGKSREIPDSQEESNLPRGDAESNNGSGVKWRYPSKVV